MKSVSADVNDSYCTKREDCGDRTERAVQFRLQDKARVGGNEENANEHRHCNVDQFKLTYYELSVENGNQNTGSNSERRSIKNRGLETNFRENQNSDKGGKKKKAFIFNRKGQCRKCGTSISRKNGAHRLQPDYCSQTSILKYIRHQDEERAAGKKKIGRVIGIKVSVLIILS